MNYKFYKLLLTILPFLLSVSMDSQAIEGLSELPTKRFAVVAGANDGGYGRIKLKYATKDAQSISDVFTSLGGVNTENLDLLLEPNRDDLLGAIKRVKTEIESLPQGQRAEFIFYYSGHSDEQDLLLGSETLSYLDLKSEIEKVNADVHLAILDSCSSGAFTRLKGGSLIKPFLINSAVDVSGYAYLTSSSADEAAQENDIIQGAYFTHFLVSALRGAGDLTDDKKVSLNEAYNFAFNETLAKTETSLHGPQHAAYDIQLSGEGDLVLTDLTDTSSEMVFDSSIKGRLYVRDSEKRLVVELSKHNPKPVKLGLDEGEYSVVLEAEGQYFESKTIQLNESVQVVSLDDFKEVDKLEGILKGNNERKRDWKVYVQDNQYYNSSQLTDDYEFDDSFLTVGIRAPIGNSFFADFSYGRFDERYTLSRVYKFRFGKEGIFGSKSRPENGQYISVGFDRVDWHHQAWYGNVGDKYTYVDYLIEYGAKKYFGPRWFEMLLDASVVYVYSDDEGMFQPRLGTGFRVNNRFELNLTAGPLSRLNTDKYQNNFSEAYDRFYLSSSFGYNF